mgnify:CR=1 FL=1
MIEACTSSPSWAGGGDCWVFQPIFGIILCRHIWHNFMQAYLAYLFMQAMLNLWERFIGFVFFPDLLCKHAFCATISFLFRKDIWEITHIFGMHIKRKEG